MGVGGERTVRGGGLIDKQGGEFIDKHRRMSVVITQHAEGGGGGKGGERTRHERERDTVRERDEGGGKGNKRNTCLLLLIPH